MKFVDRTQPYRKFGSRLFLKKRRTSLNPTVQRRSENALLLLLLQDKDQQRARRDPVSFANLEAPSLAVVGDIGVDE
jgi:hypothetical protein